MKLWSLEPGERLLRTLSGHGSKVLSVTVYADGKRAISASQDRTLKIWDLETGEAALEFLSHGQGINAIAVDSVSRVAISASSGWDLRVFNLDTASCLFKLSGHHGAVSAVIIYA